MVREGMGAARNNEKLSHERGSGDQDQLELAGKETVQIKGRTGPLTGENQYKTDQASPPLGGPYYERVENDRERKSLSKEGGRGKGLGPIPFLLKRDNRLPLKRKTRTKGPHVTDGGGPENGSVRETQKDKRKNVK